jgi:hypothetical protein
MWVMDEYAGSVASGKDLDTIHPVDSRYFEDLVDVVHNEHPDARSG